MRKWLAVGLMTTIILAFAGCTTQPEYKIVTPEGEERDEALRDLGVATDRPSYLLTAKTPDGRSEVVHHVIRKRLVRVQYLLEQGDPLVAERELEPLLRLEEARRYYAKDMKLLQDQIARMKKDALAVDQTQLTSTRAIEEVEERYQMPSTYGESKTISPDLPPLQLPPGRMEQVLSKHVEAIDLENASIPDILNALRDVMGLNFIADQALESDQLLTIHVKDVPLHEVLSYISRNMGIAFHLGENVVWVTEAQTPDDNGPQLETRIYQLRKGFIPGSGSGVVGFGDEDSGSSQSGGGAQGQDDLLQALTDFLEDNPYNPPNAKFAVYRNKNLLVIRNSRENLRLAEGIMRTFDEIPKQVLIESRFVTISQDDLAKLGADLLGLASTNNTGGEVVSPTARNVLPTFPIEGLATDSDGNLTGQGLQLTGIIGEFQYEVIIDALKTVSSSRTISAPRVTVMNNQQARIRRGDTLRYHEELEATQPTANDGGVVIVDGDIQSQAVGEATELELGIELSVLPSISSDMRTVSLNLEAVIRDLTGFDTTNRVKLPQTAESELTTILAVNSGATVIMGGMVTSNESNSISKVPILGDIPLIGFFFRKKEVTANPEHLLIFVTATIVDPDGRFNTVADVIE